MNFGASEQDLGELASGQALLSSLNDQPQSGAKLRPNEARIVVE